ncbi:alpha/beta hydrolase fold domain-containing protein, partial [Myxococcota bacterium]|nr:alpha/beta hydrolase fold domain-containing protein [Myxococcota bacterium]
MKIVQWGSLRARVLGGEDGNGSGTGPVVVLNHGFGAPGDDLVPIGEELVRSGLLPKQVRFVFPEAPIVFSMGFGESRAWWMIDMERMQRAIMTGQVRSLARDVPAGLDEARVMLSELLDHAEQALGVTGDQLVLGGFSQGAMLATDLALRTDRKLAGLVVLSGAVVAEDLWTPRLETRRGLPVFQSHGARDPILPIFAAEHLHRMFVSAGLDAHFVRFGG